MWWIWAGLWAPGSEAKSWGQVPISYFPAYPRVESESSQGLQLSASPPERLLLSPEDGLSQGSAALTADFRGRTGSAYFLS